MSNSTCEKDLQSATEGQRRKTLRFNPWGGFALGFGVGLLVIHLGVTRPLADQFTRLEERFVRLQSSVYKLTGQAGQAAKGNELLDLLVAQGRRSQAASEALTEIDQLHAKLIDEREMLAAAQSTLDRMVRLRETLQAEARRLDEARQALGNLVDLKARLAAEADRHSTAAAAIDQWTRLNDRLIEASCDAHEAQQSLEGLVQLKMRLAAENERQAEAANTVDQWSRLNDRLLQVAPGAGPARQAAEEMLAIQEEILCGSDPQRPTRAREALDDLVAIRARLHEQTAELPAAEQGLEGLVGLKSRVLAQTSDLSEAVATLETAADLQRQFTATSRSFDALRRWLNEVLLLEPTIERAATMLKPLAELGNLRHLTPSELRQAAKTIADERATSVARKVDANHLDSQFQGLPPTASGPPIDAVDQD